MRNLKKVLALALATVMLLGMMAMASATDYTDAADINEKYDVAVDVMTAVGVFEGNPNGGFNPKGELTREAAAKIAVYVALTQDTAKYVTAVEAPFDDVAADRWSAGAIVAAKNLGLINGVGDNKFAPTDDLTGYAFAKMMLGVLGYKASEEGFTGSGWEFNVNMAAAKAGLLKGLDASKLANTMTREEAAQMAFNALKAQPVVYVGGSSVSINGITITTGAQKTAETYYDEETEENVAYANLYTKLYPKLAPATKVDAFGYAYNTWKYDGKEVAAGKNYTVLATYAGDLSALTTGALYTLTNKAASVAVYVNGADAAITTVTPADKGTAKVLANDTYNYTGATVELVKNAGKYELRVAKAEVVKVADVVAATSTAKRQIKITGCANVETEDYAKDQYILAWVKEAGETDKVIKHAAITDADTAYGLINEVAGTAGAPTAVYVDGTKYTLAGANVVGTASKVYALNTTNKCTVVLQNGYATDVIDDVVTVDPSLANYVYVINVNGTKVNGTWGTTEPDYFQTQVVHMDGTVATIKAANKYDYNTYGNMAKLTANDNGTYTVAAINNGAEGEKFYIEAPDATLNFEKKVFDLTTAGQKAYTSAKTQVLNITKENSFVKTAKLAALPTKGTVTAEFIVSLKNATASKNDAQVIIVVDQAVSVTSTDLYYAVETVLSSRYDATAKEYYQKINVIEIATGEKKVVEIKASETDRSGFVTATVTDGIYDFATAGGDSKYAAADKITVYNGLLTVAVDSLWTDVDAADYVVYDTTTNGIDTVAKLVAKNDTKGVTFAYKTVDEVTYVVVIGVDA